MTDASPTADGPRVRVLVADDHPVFREAVAAAVNGADDLELVALADDGRVAQERLGALKPDVAVLDIEMPGIGGPDLARWIASEGLDIRIIFLSAHQDGTVVYDALASGGDAYVTKDQPMREIIAAIRDVAAGVKHLSAPIHDAVIGEIRARADREALHLTEREQTVLQHAAAGATVADMAGLMHLSVATVKTHLSTLYAKLGVSDRAGAVAEAMRRKLLS